ncbi:MAG: hypothetical protein ABIK31_04245, partial [candidate division WOR-3 bacterium]
VDKVLDFLLGDGLWLSVGKDAQKLLQGVGISFDTSGAEAFDGEQLNKVALYGHKKKFDESFEDVRQYSRLALVLRIFIVDLKTVLPL